MEKQTVKRTERGWPGHFICAHRCYFRRNTLLECGDRKLIVSTVGNFVEKEGGTPTPIGYQRWYETMVFHASQQGPYLDADVHKDVTSLISGSETPWGIFGETSRELPDNVDNIANDLHEAHVAYLTRSLEEGSIGEWVDPWAEDDANE